jgi:hypothetical protein
MSLDCFNMALQPRFGLMCHVQPLGDSELPRWCSCRKVQGYCEFVLNWLKKSP